MCIIAVKKSGVVFPSVETMKNCFCANSDGAGYAFSYSGILHYEKGIMTWEKFEKRYKEIMTMDTRIPFIFHFRIGTHGKKRSAEHCHPFPVCGDIKTMEKKKGSAETVLFHNGILRGFGNDIISDTMEFVEKIISPFSFSMLEKSTEIHKMIGNIIGHDKLAIMHKNGAILLFGQYIENDGMLYSNSTYETSYNDAWYDFPLWEAATKKRNNDENIEDIMSEAGLYKMKPGEKYRQEGEKGEKIVTNSMSLWTDGLDVYTDEFDIIGEILY